MYEETVVSSFNIRSVSEFGLSPHAFDQIKLRVKAFAFYSRAQIHDYVHPRMKAAEVVAFEALNKPICKIQFPHEESNGLIDLFAVVDVKPDNVGIVCTFLSATLFNRFLRQGRYFLPCEYQTYYLANRASSCNV